MVAGSGGEEKVVAVDGRMSHPEIFGFQDVIKIKNKSSIFS